MSLVFKTPISTLNTTTRSGQNIGSGNCPDCPEPTLTTGSAEYTENGEYTLTPESGVDGFSSVEISVSVPAAEPTLETASETYTENGSYTISPSQGYDGLSEVDITVDVDTSAAYYDGYDAGYDVGLTNGISEQKAKLISTSLTSNGTVTREDGWNEVTVLVTPTLQSKTVTPSTSSQTIEPDLDYDGLSLVNVNAVTSAIDANITTGNIKSGVTILGVQGTYDPQPNLSNLNITPSTNSQEYNPAISGVDGYSLVRVNAVTAAIDNNITAGNIKKDVAILGVTGTYDPQPTLQDKTVTPTTSQQVISADNGYDGLDEVTVSAVTSAIDQNIVAGNIKSGVSILGVQGTVQEGITPTGNINITNTSSTDVTNYATAQVVDANLAAGNIKNGVSILGVTGSYDPQPNLETGYAYTAEIIGTHILEPSSGYDGMDAVELTVDASPIGCFYNPFSCLEQSNIEMIDELDFQAGFALMLVNRGEIDSTTGYYVANDENGNTFRIMPFVDNPDFDPEAEEDPVLNPSLAFPENFDLVDDEIIVNFNKSNATVTVDDSDPEDVVYTVDIDECNLESINLNANFDTFLLRSINTSSNELSLSTNNTKQFSITCSEPWEIEIDEPNRNLRSLSKSGLRSDAPEPEPTLEISEMSGDPGTYTLNILSTTDQNTGFTVRGLNTRYEQHIDVSSVGNYFTIESLEDNNTITFNSHINITLEYSDDEGATWTTTSPTLQSSRYITTWTIDTGDKLMFRNNADQYSSGTMASGNYCHFTSTATVDVYGHLGSLINSENFNSVQLYSNYVFSGFFYGLQVVDASELVLPNPYKFSYYEMFRDCSELENAPALPFEHLSESCYQSMFQGCTSLTETPELPALLLAPSCYQYMFNGCTSIVTSPYLPAKTAEQSCYQNMFGGCTSLEEAGDIAATSLANTCFYAMFWGCTSLTKAPELPCTSSAAQQCYGSMFRECTSLETAPDLPMLNIPRNGYSSMFYGCSSLNYVYCAATTIQQNGTTSWLEGVAAEGTFVKNPNMADWTADSVSGIPTGWTTYNEGEEP